jgi:hypothetical protein
MAKNTELKVRLSLEVTPAVREQIEEMAKRCKATSLTEVIRKSLALLDLYLDHVDEGGTVVFRHADGSEERLRVL